MIDQKLTTEERILRAMRLALVDVIKDTTTQPGLKHPLSERTRNEIRHCLDLITARQMELAEAAGIPMKERPRYIDEPRQSVVVPLNSPEPKKQPSNPRDEE